MKRLASFSIKAVVSYTKIQNITVLPTNWWQTNIQRRWSDRSATVL